MDTIDIAQTVRLASIRAVQAYLSMCDLNSAWEVPEVFLAVEAAKALHEQGLRIMIEFKLDRALNAPKPDAQNAPSAVTRLQSAYAYLDLAIVKPDPNPWNLSLDGVVEFKKHASLFNDGELITFMRQSGLNHGILVLLVVGPSAEAIQQQAQRLTKSLTGSWRHMDGEAPVPTVEAAGVRDRWWNICCLVAS